MKPSKTDQLESILFKDPERISDIIVSHLSSPVNQHSKQAMAYTILHGQLVIATLNVPYDLHNKLQFFVPMDCTLPSQVRLHELRERSWTGINRHGFSGNDRFNFDDFTTEVGEYEEDWIPIRTANSFTVITYDKVVI